VRFLRATKEKLLYELGKREQVLLLQILKLYPRIPSAFHPLSRNSKLPDAESSQRMLDEALAEQRSENKKRLQRFLEAPHRFQQNDTGYRLSLSPSEAEWLLQILNDIRVGSWVILGSPEQKGQLRLLNEKTAPHFWAMEMAGSFQMDLLAGMERERDA
jgi:hypothetical protein